MEGLSFSTCLSEMSWIRSRLPVRFRIQVILVTSSLVICLIYLLPPTTWTRGDHQRLVQDLHHEDSPTSTAATTTTTTNLPLPTPYYQALSETESTGLCADRFGRNYLRAFSETLTSYCDTNSAANLTCFSNKARDERTDSFCIGRPAILDSAKKTFELDCNLRDWNEEEVAKHIPKLHQFPAYWYNTGPHAVFSQNIKLGGTSESPSPLSDAEGFSFLIRREDNHQNLWHTMMEIMSLTLSLDVLRTTVDPATGSPFFTEDSIEHSQVVFLDDLEDGPFYDLWRISARKPIVRINDVLANDLSPTKIVIPLPGGSNPFWQGDWEEIPCGKSELLSAFSRRVLDFYGIPHRAPRDKGSLTLTLIDRKQKRRLVDQETYFANLVTKFPNVKIQLVDYAALPLSEQIRITHSTDILLGVHGAGLTQGMFLPPNSTIVEILPPTLMHKGFDNMSKFLGHRYFSRHGSQHESPDNTGDWQHDDVFIEEDRFMKMMEAAIAKATG